MLRQRPEVLARGVKINVPEALDEWCRTETRLGNPALTARVKETGDAELQAALDWSIAVNKSIDAMVHAVPPFPFVRECLAQMHTRADVLVCSATPNAALEKNGPNTISPSMSKKFAARDRQQKRNPGQREKIWPAANADDRRRPGRLPSRQSQCVSLLPDQSRSGRKQLGTAASRRLTAILHGSFAGAYQDQLLAEFLALLPEQPKWRTV